jgi:hypothetical protein
VDQHARKDIGAVGKAEPDYRACLVELPVRGDEFAHAVRRPGQILAVIDTFRLATEEACRSVFRYVAARRNHRRLWQQVATEIEELVLVAAGPVEHEEDRRTGCTGPRPVHVTVMAHDCLLARLTP